MTPARRRYVYGVAMAVLPLLVVAGWLTESYVPHLVVLLGVVLVPDLARRNVTDAPPGKAP